MYNKSYNKSYNKKTKHFHQKVLHILYFNIEHVLQIWMYTFIGNVCFFLSIRRVCLVFYNYWLSNGIPCIELVRVTGVSKQSPVSAWSCHIVYTDRTTPNSISSIFHKDPTAWPESSFVLYMNCNLSLFWFHFYNSLNTLPE